MHSPFSFAVDEAKPLKPNKKARITNSTGTKRSRKAGKLAGIMRMPVDIFFEVRTRLSTIYITLMSACLMVPQISVHLMPLDLLHLARTSRGLRELLLKRSAAFIWRAALANVPDLPPCPDNMSELAYSSFLFDKFCQVSLLFSTNRCSTYSLQDLDCTRRVSRLYIPLMRRYCKSCAKL